MRAAPNSLFVSESEATCKKWHHDNLRTNAITAGNENMSDKQIAVINDTSAIESMLQTTLKSGLTTDNAAAVEKMLDVYERMKAKAAEREYASDFVALKLEMKPIKATRPVKNKDGTLRYTFAPFEDIMEEVEPLALKHGFAITFGEDDSAGDGKKKAVCKVTHVSGHRETATFTVRAVQGAPGCSDAQIDGGAMTYAKRFALANALGIVIEKDIDADARALGEPITAEQARRLRESVADLNVNEAKFLKYARAETFEEIMSGRYSDLDAWLQKTAAAK